MNLSLKLTEVQELFMCVDVLMPFVLNTEHRTLKPTRAKAISQESKEPRMENCEIGKNLVSHLVSHLV